MKCGVTCFLMATGLMLAMARADFTVAWDANPASDNVAQYRLYDLKDPANLLDDVLVAVVAGSETSFTSKNLAAGSHWWIVTARNAQGLESPPSAALEIIVPSSPQNFRLVADLTVSIIHTDERGKRELVRTDVELPGLAGIVQGKVEIR